MGTWEKTLGMSHEWCHMSNLLCCLVRRKILYSTVWVKCPSGEWCLINRGAWAATGYSRLFAWQKLDFPEVVHPKIFYRKVSCPPGWCMVNSPLIYTVLKSQHNYCGCQFNDIHTLVFSAYHCLCFAVLYIASTQALPFSVFYHNRSIRQNTVLIVQ